METILYYVILLLALIGGFIYWLRLRGRLFKKKVIHEDIIHYSIQDLDKMQDGTEFEEYLTKLLKRLGYSDVYKTVKSRDFGADIVFTDSEGFRNVIQAKRFSVSNLVGLSAVQEIFASMRYYKAKKSMVITTSTYTSGCETLAGVNHVKLIDRGELTKIIEAFRTNEIHKARSIIESEPRIIYESWKEMKEPPEEIKMDRKFHIQ